MLISAEMTAQDAGGTIGILNLLTKLRCAEDLLQHLERFLASFCLKSYTTNASPSEILSHFRPYSPGSAANVDLAPRLDDILLDAKYQEVRQLTASNPAKDPSVPSRDGSCSWNCLPRELRDDIFRYAYGRRAGGLKILFKAQIDLYNKWDNPTWMGSSNTFRVSVAHMRTSAQQSWDMVKCARN